MKIVNVDDMKKVCGKRGWDIKDYIDEVDTYIGNNGRFNEAVIHYENDMFLLEKGATALFIRGEEEKIISWSDADFAKLEADGWDFFAIEDEPEYMFYEGKK